MAGNGNGQNGNGKAGNGQKKIAKNIATMPGGNGGTLQRGNFGNRGGTGRPPSLVRQVCRGAFANRIATLRQIADGEVPEASVVDRLKAIDLLGKYGLGTTITETDTEGRDVAPPPGRLTPEQRKATIARLLAETRN